MIFCNCGTENDLKYYKLNGYKLNLYSQFIVSCETCSINSIHLEVLINNKIVKSVSEGEYLMEEALS